jgi:CheY-like chemotaxis protein
MKLLIVEDDPSLAEVTSGLLHSVDDTPKQFEAITLAADLQTAIRLLPEYDAVLCDGMFPLAPESSFVVDDWDVIRQEATRRGIHFVLYSGSARALDCARASNTRAITKPAAVEEIYAALTDRPLPIPISVVEHPAPGSGEPSAEQTDLAGNLDEYRRELESKVDAMERQAEIDACSGHLHAFNFGRTLARIELSREQMWLRARWLLFGAAAGVAIATILAQVFSHSAFLPTLR